MADGEQADGTDGLGLVDKILEIIDRRSFEHFAAFACGVAHMQDDVRDGIKVELRRVRRQAQLPLAARDPGAFEGQIALIPQVGFEQTAVSLSGAGDDGLHRPVVIVEAGVIGALSRVLAVRSRC